MELLAPLPLLALSTIFFLTSIISVVTGSTSLITVPAMLQFEQSDADALPFPVASFDAVVSAFGMPHFPDPKAVVQEAYRVLKSRGRFAFTVWDVPNKVVGFGAIYDAIRAYGTLDVGLPVGPNFFLFSDPAQSQSVLQAAGLSSPLITPVPQVWSVAAPEEVFDATLQGSVRAAATLRGQSHAAREAIKAAVSQVIRGFRRGDQYEVPMPAVLAVAIKPAP